jgi:hypothetical protein
MKGAVQAVCKIFGPNVKWYFFWSFLLYLGTGGVMIYYLFTSVQTSLCARNPSDLPMNCKCPDDFFICYKCQIEDIPAGYNITGKTAKYRNDAEVSFIDSQKLKAHCLPGFDDATTAKTNIVCPANESIFEYTGCPENRCKIFPKGTPGVPDFPSSRYLVSGCRATASFVAKSSCRIRCKDATPSYNMTDNTNSLLVPITCRACSTSSRST